MCKSLCIIYFAQCIHCLKCYIGKTIQELRSSIAGHRAHSFAPLSEVTDENCLAAHLTVDHSINGSDGFNKSYKFSVLEHVSTPRVLLTREQFHINSLRTFQPFGLNMSDPIGLKARLVLVNG